MNVLEMIEGCRNNIIGVDVMIYKKDNTIFRRVYSYSEALTKGTEDEIFDNTIVKAFKLDNKILCMAANEK